MFSNKFKHMKSQASHFLHSSAYWYSNQVKNRPNMQITAVHKVVLKTLYFACTTIPFDGLCLGQAKPSSPNQARKKSIPWNPVACLLLIKVLVIQIPVFYVCMGCNSFDIIVHFILYVYFVLYMRAYFYVIPPFGWRYKCCLAFFTVSRIRSTYARENL